MSAALHAADALGIDRRHFRTGIWHAMMTVVIEAADPEDLVTILEDRISSIRGYGHNPDSPLHYLSDAEGDVRKTASAAVAELVLSYVNPLIETIDARGEDGVTPLLDTILQTLAESWGPHHLRRILKDQVIAINDGHAAPVMPIEPVSVNRPKIQQVRPQSADAVPETVSKVNIALPIPQVLQAPEPEKRTIPGRMVSVHVIADIAWDGAGLYGVAMSVSHPGTDRTEIREIAGSCDARGSSRLAYLAGCMEALASLGEPSTDEPVTFVTGPDFLPPNPGNPARTPQEESLRNRFEKACLGRKVTWMTGRGGIGTSLAERADRILRFRNEESERLRTA